MRNFLQVMTQSKFNSDASQLTCSTLANETISKGEWRLLAFLLRCLCLIRSVGGNALHHTAWKRQCVVDERARAAVLFFTIFGWKQKDISL